MPTQKIDPKVIFASNAPAMDKPPVFGDKTKGWDVARANDGRPTIKEMNKVQQDTDLKILWLNENSVTPYDESIDYPDGAVAIKDGSFKQLVSDAWVEFLDDFANKDEVKRGIANRYDPLLTYNSGERVVLTNGDIVKSTIDGNTNDPNVDMTGWRKPQASEIFDESGKTQQEVNNLIQVESISSLRSIYAKSKGDKAYLVSVIKDANKGGGTFVATTKGSLVDNGGTIVSSANESFVWVRVNYEIIDPYMFGALGNGIFDDTDALTRMSQFTTVVHFKKGSYVYNGSGLNPSNQNWSYTADGKELVTVTLGSESYFIDTPTGTNRIVLTDFTIKGGYGAFRSTNTGSLVAGRKTITRNSFEGYTRCAIDTQHNDMPYWDITYNLFNALSSTGTIGIALGRNSDASIIKSNTFMRNEVHVKMRVSGKFDIESNDFIMFDRLNTNGRAHVWLIADDNTPIHANISGNKFGNEGQISTDYPILIASESSSTGTNGQRLPDYNTATPLGLYRIIATNNLIAGGTGFSSFVRSLSPQLRYASFDNNIMYGTYPQNFLTFVNGVDNRYSAIYFDAAFTEQAITTQFSLCNVAANVFVGDPVLAEIGSRAHVSYSQSNRVGYKSLIDSKLSTYTTSSVTSTNTTDADGKDNAVNISVSAANGYIYSAISTLIDLVTPTWLEVDLSSSDPDMRVYVQIYDTTGAMIQRRSIANLTTTPKKFVIGFQPHSTMRVRIAFSKVGGVTVGRCKLYQSKFPVQTGLSTLDSAKILTMSTIYADDVAAATAGITIGEMYCSTGGVVKVRLV